MQDALCWGLCHDSSGVVGLGENPGVPTRSQHSLPWRLTLTAWLRRTGQVAPICPAPPRGKGGPRHSPRGAGGPSPTGCPNPAGGVLLHGHWPLPPHSESHQPSFTPVDAGMCAHGVPVRSGLTQFCTNCSSLGHWELSFASWDHSFQLTKCSLADGGKQRGQGGPWTANNMLHTCRCAPHMHTHR